MTTTVGAVQLPFQICSSPQEFADAVRSPIEEAAGMGAQLVLLPHLSSLMLFGMFDVDVAADAGPEQFAERQGASVREWLQPRAGYVYEFYMHLFQSLARRHEIWLAPGTVIESEGHNMHLTGFLLNPDGEIVGRQRKMNLSGREQAWGIQPGDTMRVFQTEIGDMVLLTGEDSGAADVVAGHAEIVLHPTAAQARFSSSAGAELVQRSGAFVAAANLVGAGYGGGAGIYAPRTVTGLEIEPATSEANASMVVTAALNLEALRGGSHIS